VPGLFLNEEKNTSTEDWLQSVRTWLQSIYADLMVQGYKLHEIDQMDICRYGEILCYMHRAEAEKQKQAEIDEENAKKDALIRMLG
jgi:hypothetical protein